MTPSALGDWPYTVYVNSDVKAWDRPTPYDYLNKNPVGAYRCFWGHRAMLRNADDSLLVFEDDASPRDDSWKAAVESAAKLLGEYEVVSLHARRMKWKAKTFEFEGRTYSVPDPNSNVETYSGQIFHGSWALGSCAYLISALAACDLGAMEWDGLPVDLLLCNRFKFCAMVDSPFVHDQSGGSIVEGTK